MKHVMPNQTFLDYEFRPIGNRGLRILLLRAPMIDYMHDYENIRGAVGGGNENDPPLGLLHLSGAIKESFPDTRFSVLNLWHSESPEESLLKRILSFRPTHLFVTMLSEQRMSSIQMMLLAKRIDSRIKCIVGGAHPSAARMDVQLAVNYDFIDHIVPGEGEIPIVKLLSGELSDRITPRFRMKDRGASPMPHWDLIEDLKSVCPNNVCRHGCHMRESRTPIMLSLSCPYRCKFCSVPSVLGKYTYRRIDSIDEELSYLASRGVRDLVIRDDIFGVVKSEAMSMCDLMIDRNYGMRWYATSRLDACDQEMYEKFAEAGCYEMSFGLESGSDAMLRAIGKGKKQTKESARKSIEMCCKAGIRPTLLCIVGFPGESDETIAETCAYICDLKDMCAKYGMEPGIGSVGGLLVMPGTPIYEDCVKSGWLTDDYWLLDTPAPYYTRERHKTVLDKWDQMLNDTIR